MVDIFGVDKGNISLPSRLQSPQVLDGHTDDTKQVMILNMQKAFYQVRIEDIAKRIQRLQSKNTELEELCVAEKLIRSQTDVETGDQITQLNQQIFSEVEKINDYKKRINAVQRWMEEEKQAHLDKVEAANKKYADTRLAITSEIKVLNAKINSLEEYKVSKTDLRNKLKAGNNLMAKRDEEVKQRREQIQRKFKIGREKLKKEMYARLQGLAGTLQIEAAASIAKPIHGLMRENIFLKKELIDIVKESVPKKEKIKLNKAADERIINETTMSKKHTVKHLIESKIQGYLLAAVKEQHTRVKDCLEEFKDFDDKIKVDSAEVTYDLAKTQADKALQYISRLETGLHRQQTQLGIVIYLKDRSKTELQRCTDVLYDAKYAVACALKMTDTGKDILEMGDKQLMIYLMDILRRSDTERWKNRTPSLATVPPPEEALKIGDLGFDPSHIELSGSRRATIQKKSSKLSTFKILAGLGIRLSKINSAGNENQASQMSIYDLTEELKNMMDEKTDEMSKESSLSLPSRGEELEQKPLQPDPLGEVKSEIEEEEETEAERKLETDEEDASAKQDEIDIDETLTDHNKIDASTQLIAEYDKVSVVKEENGTQG